jgi:hypothetical protein
VRAIRMREAMKILRGAEEVIRHSELRVGQPGQARRKPRLL